MALGLPYGAAIDAWSVGVVLAEAALRRPLLPAHTPAELLGGMEVLLGPLPWPMLAASGRGGPALGPGASAAAAAAAEQQQQQQQQGPWPAHLAGPMGSAPAAETLAALRQQLRSQVAPPLGPPLLEELRGVDPALAELVGGLLRFDPGQRLTAGQVRPLPQGGGAACWACGHLRMQRALQGGSPQMLTGI